MVKLGVLVFAVLTLTACGEKATSSRGDTGGTIVVLASQDPGTLFPPINVTVQARQICEQIYDYLADVGPDLDTRDDRTFRRELASSWNWSSDSLQISFHINPLARWHDGQRATARDVAFTFALNRNPELASRYASSLKNIDSVTVVDSLTAKFWFRRRLPTQFLDAAAQLPILPAHQLEHMRVGALRELQTVPVGTGRFRLRKWNKGESVEIVADTANYRGRARVDRVIWSIVPEFTGQLARLWRGDADLLDGLRPPDLVELSKRPTLRAIVRDGMEYVFLRFNLRDPADTSKPHSLFKDRELRRAIAMTIDRSAIIRNLLDTFATVPVGPTVRAYPTTDPKLSQLPFDSVRAAQLLDSLGWVRGADGMRARNGRALSFTILVPALINRIRAGVLLQDQLRRAGIKASLDQLDVSTELSREERGAFDATVNVWVMGSSPDGTWDAWSSQGFPPEGINFSHYANPAFDAALDSALKTDVANPRGAFTRAYTIINDDAPAVWLYEARRILAVQRRIRTNVMRPDAWWFSLADWYIPNGERVLRDRIPPPN